MHDRELLSLTQHADITVRWFYGDAGAETLVLLHQFSVGLLPRGTATAEVLFNLLQNGELQLSGLFKRRVERHRVTVPDAKVRFEPRQHASALYMRLQKAFLVRECPKLFRRLPGLFLDVILSMLETILLYIECKV